MNEILLIIFPEPISLVHLIRRQFECFLALVVGKNRKLSAISYNLDAQEHYLIRSEYTLNHAVPNDNSE